MEANLTRATTRKTGDRTVSLSYDDEFTGERRTREFWIPRNDGLKYVREGDKQVCEGLCNRGYTLSVREADELLPLIRAEWKRARAAEESERRA